MIDRVAHLRVRRVRFKDGRTLNVLPTQEGNRGAAERRIRQVMDAHGNNIAGFAFLIWDDDAASTCDMQVYDNSKLPRSVIPEMVKARLTGDMIEHCVENDFLVERRK